MSVLSEISRYNGFHESVQVQYSADFVHAVCLGMTALVMQAGEHLTISYIDLNLPVSARREELRRGFYFECHCSR